ncbi:4-(cytidine 5'-diphospho)-2-C-methyl-D-erythritol kinase [Carnobacterium divergens]|uniref:4-(cytidine 5'-diphospho)-2-C-methyl-D-erythritol kinase n=1 Tax=Carnobacterium divergens TaxID=2748 RepID=UPI001071B3A3|nr:4-(cytidine 5'-diphospho)-2-C-methyl-D-erythritol kinase [Carnobacterium divergens]TFJ39726.1 4-(cytidine 5'-diphospho)-2-C-methyl-D-erythritol kinase [Carnobacterium divergens]TFJ48703.1 4-(cytidine 5'-diphospho)-2-C-methyl-D-erythritol kinase [Carnobacterium divergens]TFJ53463.1 4-(cytidine 5'-diphospho)-2-C-methyl-D-erythritol kinase [Carnobacterium divergens]TFJ58987.1 4-(cytidine 5'-diphospho)-2-C-methyl-D-erythritol kinase [Carnobacterium divergens]TFJ69900.1 4-(cytidine 5'-diphospho)
MEIIEKAPAKLNLTLDALYKREDGYHELEMVMTTVDLADHITLKNLPEDEIIIRTTSGVLPLDKRNHAFQAAKLMKETFQIKKGVEITIEKKIPIAAGLAGGSSDAAATLRGLNRLWGLNLSLDELADLGAKVGSDVPFCVYGGTAFVTGRGDQIQHIGTMPQCWVVLVKPRVGVSTGTVFSALSFEELVHPNTNEMIAAIQNEDYQEMIQNVGNVLEHITIARHPDIERIKYKMLKFGADAALMSGSGPTVFALCEKYSRAQRVYNGLKGFCKEVYLVRTLK